MTRQELHALVADILAIHACPCLTCVNSMTGRADTILLAADQYAAEYITAAAQLIKEDR